MRLPRLLSRRAPFDLGFGMRWDVVFGLGMRDALGITTAVEVPRLSRSPDVDDAVLSGLPTASQDDRAAWDRWWSDTVACRDEATDDPLGRMERLTPWWSGVVPVLTAPVGSRANNECSRSFHQILAMIRDPETRPPEQSVCNRVDAATGPRDSLDASVAIVPVAEPCWLEQGRVLVVDEAVREAPDYEERLTRFVHDRVQPRG